MATKGQVALLTLNRPGKLNALSNDLLAAIIAALDGIELDPAVRAVVVTGAGRAFSAGADIAAFQRHMEAGPAEAVARFMRPGHRMTRRVESFPKPIIAAVNGLAFGGGCELVEATHIALAADTAIFSKAEINIGSHPDLRRHPAPAPERRPEGGDGADPERADLRHRRGRPARPGQPRPARAAIHRGMDASIDDGLAIEEAGFARIVPTHDTREGVAAFVEKRRPLYQGR